MRKLILLALIGGAWVATYATEASAVMCAKGVYRAGCIGPNGAVMGHRGYYGMGGTTVRRSAIVHPRTGGPSTHNYALIGKFRYLANASDVRAALGHPRNLITGMSPPIPSSWPPLEAAIKTNTSYFKL